MSGNWTNHYLVADEKLTPAQRKRIRIRKKENRTDGPRHQRELLRQRRLRGLLRRVGLS